MKELCNLNQLIEVIKTTAFILCFVSEHIEPINPQEVYIIDCSPSMISLCIGRGKPYQETHYIEINSSEECRSLSLKKVCGNHDELIVTATEPFAA